MYYRTKLNHFLPHFLLLSKYNLVIFPLFSSWQVNRAVFESSAGRLRVVGRAGVGIDNVDLTAATEHGCLVVNAPTANTVAAAEHGIALLAAMARNVAQADAALKAGKDLLFPWEKEITIIPTSMHTHMRTHTKKKVLSVDITKGLYQMVILFKIKIISFCLLFKKKYIKVFKCSSIKI
jgi:lactate dehydrogenase-like 2-hydroxyacid dehydrogenase